MAVPPWLLLTFTFFLTITTTHFTPSNDVVLLLTKIKPSLQGPTQNHILSSWNTSVPLCQWQGLKWVFTNGTQLICTPISSRNWSELSLSKNPALHLLSLQLPSANLFGNLPPELGDLSNLQSLYLSFNSIMGSIPLELGYSSSLQDIDFSYNLLNGSVPVSVWNLCELVSFRVHGNLLSGSIPNPGLPNASCANLTVLDFGRNLFTGVKKV
ncbi:putative non-specific serine/threonine protein kinase [Helianthus annuus]|nr:putative non-specific serine/threonine protein kinase [Helianthus annuus]